MKKDQPSKDINQNTDESIVLWVLIFIFLALTSLTVNSYSEADNKNNHQLVATPHAMSVEQNSAELKLINSNSSSQIDNKTLKM